MNIDELELLKSQSNCTSEELEKLWEIADKYNWGVIASNLDSPQSEMLNNVQMSYIFFARSNNILLFVSTYREKWRHYANVQNNKIFSFLISNTVRFDDFPEEYSRFFIQGRLTGYEAGSEKYDKYIALCRQKVPNNPILKIEPNMVYALSPTCIEFGLKTRVETSNTKELDEEQYRSISLSIFLLEDDLDSEGRYTWRLI